MLKNIFLAVLFATSVLADCYMQNPRGSNDRLNEANTDRNNGNRLFDSQNNAQGGYCLGPSMNFYSGSLLSIEWTSQHGCGNPKMYCNVVIQYMCGNNTDSPQTLIRDGTTTDTITNSAAGPTATDANGNLLYGMHESFAYYQACQARNRNQGLFIADREQQGGLNPGEASSIFTRQNNNGDQHGYECPEERDYYPYWAPSPWVDVAILTDDSSFCGFYQAQSQNVLSRFFCANPTTGVQTAPNNQADCQTAGDVWTEVPSFGLPPPVCQQAPWNRFNHLGNGIDIAAYTNSFNWTLPTEDQEPCITNDACNCVVRIRYNISTDDLGDNGNRPDQGFIDFSSNAAASPVTQDPFVTVNGQPLQLAVNTDQYGRTFQDRSYVFHIRPRPSGVSPLSRIFNVNVRGKRGNIVETFPATEYDFVPNVMAVRVGDFVHFQWTGCDTNPAGNAGEGTDQTDRHNIVEIPTFDVDIPVNDTEITQGNIVPMFDTLETRLYFAYLGQTNCPTEATLLANNGNNADTAQDDPTNCFKLNAAPQYFDGGLQRMNNTAQHFFMSTRNNNFTNRGQKATLTVATLLPVWGIVLVVVGAVTCLGASAVAGAMFYAKSHPQSQIAQLVSKM
jgi:hypothetical protein